MKVNKKEKGDREKDEDEKRRGRGGLERRNTFCIIKGPKTETKEILPFIYMISCLQYFNRMNGLKVM